MAITRHADHLHQLHNARSLRSRRVVIMPNSPLSHSHRIRKSRHLLSTTSKHQEGKQQCPSRQSNTFEDVQTKGRRESIRDTHHTHEQFALSINDEVGGGSSDSPIFNPGSVTVAPEVSIPSMPVFNYLTAAAHVDHTASHREDEGPRSAMSALRIPSVNLEDVGTPSDGLWNVNAAYEQRFCYIHGESEYLLGTEDRWMSSTDFELRDADVTLKAMLHRRKDIPSAFDPHAQRCQAECEGSLLSHVHRVFESRKEDDLTLYYMEWKACWTPESMIGDKMWIGESLKANKNGSYRRSARVENGFENRKRNFESMMVVINIE